MCNPLPKSKDTPASVPPIFILLHGPKSLPSFPRRRESTARTTKQFLSCSVLAFILTRCGSRSHTPPPRHSRPFSRHYHENTFHYPSLSPFVLSEGMGLNIRRTEAGCSTPCRSRRTPPTRCPRLSPRHSRAGGNPRPGPSSNYPSYKPPNLHPTASYQRLNFHSPKPHQPRQRHGQKTQTRLEELGARS